MLTFKVSPSFEDMSGDSQPYDTYTYKVVVQASDGATMNTDLNWFKVTVRRSPTWKRKGRYEPAPDGASNR